MRGDIRSIEKIVYTHKGLTEYQRIRYSKILKAVKNQQTGYMRVGLCDELGRQKIWLVHRLMLLSFKVPNPENKKCVNHKNSVRDDNRLENLEWATHSENNKHAFRSGYKTQNGSKNHRAKLKECQVLEIREKYNGNKSRKELSILYNVSEQTITDIFCRKSWKHVQ